MTKHYYMYMLCLVVCPMASYVLGKNPQTFSEAVDAARLAEFSVAQGASHADQQLCTQLAEMRQDIQKLAQRYNSMSLTVAIQRERTRSRPLPRVRSLFRVMAVLSYLTTV